MCRRDAPIVEVGRDLAQRSSGRALRPDVVDEVRFEDARPSPARPLRPRSSWPPLLGDKALELVDGDELRAPRHLDRLDQRQDAAVERGAADAESRGRLGARVGKSFDTCRLSNDFDWCRGRLGSFVPSSLLIPASEAAAGHSYSVHK